ncbi:endonuclease/exonuclease/phosphatase family protein [Phormidium sp. CLA17]|uniref:endonuclease/exonuclease/phosphatase family protein n=1 Tax=Leptolyngbya sp. Cla-17 TaxID=2803751 RepID=UPI0014912C78|nr:endonuclease/exonuclease/phosphatase family protein [Leptolyngbya sp. Cla-17]MBM0744325.1 endonuclease/exonuclease/phosphatase family protein [Leptolyngbya sp. Cla-17]
MKAIKSFIKIPLYGLLILTSVLSLGIPFWWSYPLELLSHFRVYYLLLSGGLAIAFFLAHLHQQRVRLALLISLALVVFNGTWIIPWYLPHPQPAAGDLVRVLAFNINVANDQWDAIATAVRSVNPDIAVLMETSPEATAELSQRLGNVLPSVYRTSGGGLTILSRFNLISPESKQLNGGTILSTSLQINQKVVKVVAAHPIVPVKPNLFHRRNTLLAEITTDLQQQSQKSLIFLGDLNLTPWSPYYNRFVRRTKLHNTRLGFGIEPSWIEAATHVRYPRWVTALVKLSIDHIFVSSDIQVVSCTTSKAANSDHRMLWSDLTL